MAFDQAKADEVCERLSEGEPLAQICRSEGMPKVRTVYDWRDENPSFAAGFARAREVGYDIIAQDCADIADDGSRDYIAGEDRMVVDHDHIQRSKLRVDTRLKLLAKWDPKRYGDRIAHDVDGKLEITVRDLAREDGDK